LETLGALSQLRVSILKTDKPDAKTRTPSVERERERERGGVKQNQRKRGEETQRVLS
jgi:hypothetical protein